MNLKLLAVDKGNTRTKVGTWHQEAGLLVAAFENENSAAIIEYIKKQEFTASIISSVAASSLEDVPELMKDRGTCVVLNATTPLPLKNAYATPLTLGTDRIAGAIGAWKLVNHENVLLIDAGTCINYECVVDHTYIGGAISPGLNMRLKAMHTFTGKLPQPEIPAGEVKITGNSTETCLLSGAVVGAALEVEGAIQAYNREYPGIKIVLSGGDADHLGKYLKNTIFARPNEIVMSGLLEILKHYLNV